MQAARLRRPLRRDPRSIEGAHVGVLEPWALRAALAASVAALCARALRHVYRARPSRNGTTRRASLTSRSRCGDLLCQFRLTIQGCQSTLTGMDIEELSVDLSSDDPAIGLRASLALHRLAERVEANHVASAREKGWSWQQIGERFGRHPPIRAQQIRQGVIMTTGFRGARGASRLGHLPAGQ